MLHLLVCILTLKLFLSMREASLQPLNKRRSIIFCVWNIKRGQLEALKIGGHPHHAWEQACVLWQQDSKAKPKSSFRPAYLWALLTTT